MIKPTRHMEQATADIEFNIISSNNLELKDIDASNSQITTTPVPGVSSQSADEAKYPSKGKLSLVMLGLCFATFLIALDRTIIATAIPKISDEFQSLGDIGWYASGYLLTNCSLVLVYGRIYTYYNPKKVYLICITIFEIGSAICGAAPNSNTLIAGRAISGVGSSGIYSGGIIILYYSIPLHRRSVYIGFLASMWGIASSVGPILGGALTTKISWRWCFYINLPFGVVTIAVVFFLVNIPDHEGPSLPLKQRIASLDPLGILCFVPGTICLLLALQLGGTTYSWSDPRIIAALSMFGILIVSFFIIQVWKGDEALIPPRIILQRNIAASTWFVFWLGTSMTLLAFFLPIWFQAIQGVDAVESGIRVIPMVLTLNIFSILTGIAIRYVGYSAPFMLLGSIIMPLGTGLMTLFKVDTPASQWIGYQILYGAGIGFGLEQGPLVAQTILQKEDIPIGTSCIVFFQSLGGAIFASVGQNLLSNTLTSSLENIPGLNLDSSAIVQIGATDLRSIVPLDLLPEVLKVYNGAIVKVFDVAVAATSLTVLGALGVEWISMKKGAQKKTEERGG